MSKRCSLAVNHAELEQGTLWSALASPSSSSTSSEVGAAAGPIEDVVASLAPSTDFEVTTREAVAAVAKATRKAFGSGSYVLPFGSVVQGSHIPGSDLDLCIHAPHLAEEQPIDNARQVQALKWLLQELPYSFRVLETRFSKHIRVPIAVLLFEGSTGCPVEVDVSIGVTTGTGVEKGFVDRLVRRVLARAPQVLPFVRIVKRWAKVEHLNKAFDGFLNSLGWTLLVLYWFMERGEICASLMEGEEEFEGSFRGSSCLPPPLEVVSAPLPSLEDLASFFHMVAGFREYLADEDDEEGDAWGFSVLDHGLCRGPGLDTSPFFIEDPGARLAAGKAENVARSLRDHTWRTIIRRCRMAGAALHQDGSDSSMLLRKLRMPEVCSRPAKAAKRKAQKGELPAEPEQSDDTTSTTASSRSQSQTEREHKLKRQRRDADEQGGRAWEWKQ